MVYKMCVLEFVPLIDPASLARDRMSSFHKDEESVFQQAGWIHQKGLNKYSIDKYTPTLC